MSAFKGSGNKFKGNKQTKGGRGKKNATAKFDEDTDINAIVESNLGGAHLKMINIKDGRSFRATIPGKFRKKIWFKAGDAVVVTKVMDNVFEIKGKISDFDMAKIRGQIEKLNQQNGDIKCNIHFGDENDVFSESDDDDETEVTKPIPKDRAKNLQKGVARVARATDDIPKDSTSTDKEDEDFDFNAI